MSGKSIKRDFFPLIIKVVQKDSPVSKSAFKRQIRPCSGAESRQKMSPKREQESALW